MTTLTNTHRVLIQAQPETVFALRTVIYPLIGRPMMDKAVAALKTKLESPQHG